MSEYSNEELEEQTLQLYQEMFSMVMKSVLPIVVLQ